MIKRCIVAAFILSIFLGSCGKYDDGPLISLMPKKSRVVNSWKIEKILKKGNEVDVEDSLLRNYREYKSDGTVLFYNENEETIEGVWDFFDKKQYIISTIYMDDQAYKEKGKILKLKNKELWLQVEYGTYVWELHFIEKN